MIIDFLHYSTKGRTGSSRFGARSSSPHRSDPDQRLCLSNAKFGELYQLKLFDNSGRKYTFGKPLEHLFEKGAKPAAILGSTLPISEYF